MTTLRELRTAKGWTQEQLAAELGIDSSSVCNYEKGRRRPEYETLYKIAEIFDISVAQAHNIFLRRSLAKRKQKAVAK